MTLSVEIKHSYPGFSLDVAFNAPIGVTALVGPSGSGKTTVVNAVAGLVSPDKGRIQIGDRVVFDRGRGVDIAPPQRRIGYVFQDARLFPHLNVKQNLLYGRWFRPRSGGADYSLVVDMLGIAPLLRRRTTDLSGGEKQRVAIGRALLSNPELLVMDEPLAALDAARKAEIIPYLLQLRDEIRLPILYISHSEAETSALADLKVVLENGRICALKANPSSYVTPMDNQDAPAVLTLAGRVLAGYEGRPCAFQTEAGCIEMVEGSGLSPTSVTIAARDLLLSVSSAEGLAARGILEAQIEAMGPALTNDGVEVALRIGSARITLNLSRANVQRLGLVVGQSVHLIVTDARFNYG